MQTKLSERLYLQGFRHPERHHEIHEAAEALDHAADGMNRSNPFLDTDLAYAFRRARLLYQDLTGNLCDADWVFPVPDTGHALD